MNISARTAAARRRMASSGTPLINARHPSVSTVANSAAFKTPSPYAITAKRAMRLVGAASVSAAAALMPGIASAAPISGSSVTLYGILDTGAEFLTNAASSNGSNHNVLRMTSGNMSGSRWGLQGTEDLGSGSKVFFRLENGFNLDTGAGLQGSRQFGRLAYVGIANKTYGSISLGRQGGLFLDWMSKYNPLGNAVYAIKMQDSAFSDRLDNTLRYEYDLSGFKALAQYSFGYDNVSYGAQPAGNTRLARVIEAGLMYSHGPFSASVVYDQKNGGSLLENAATTTKVGGFDGNQDRRIGVGASYRLKAFRFYGGYRYKDGAATHLTTLTSGPVEASSLYWLGATYFIQPSWTVSSTAMYQNFYGTSRDPWSFQVDTDYSLSKRTDVYLNLGYVLNQHGSNLGLNGFGTDVVAGKNQFGAMMGIRHRF